MDLKPHSCTADPCPDWLERHREFLRVVRGARPSHTPVPPCSHTPIRSPRLLLKLIVGAEADEGELRAAFRLTAEEAPGSSLTLQPVTPLGPVARAPSMEAMLRWHAVASEYVPEVRLIPQLHKLMQVL
jgi:hypothetical protein